MIIDTLQKRLFAFNYWSKYNDTLFDFAIDDSIAIHVPVRLLLSSSIVLKKLLAEGMSADEILEKLK